AALRLPHRPGRARTDLGEAWTEWTGLPFAFPLWQVSAGSERDHDLRRLHRLLLESRASFATRAERLARRFTGEVGLPPDRLLAYWRSLVYQVDDRMLAGLHHYYELAAELGEIPAVP